MRVDEPAGEGVGTILLPGLTPTLLLTQVREVDGLRAEMAARAQALEAQLKEVEARGRREADDATAEVVTLKRRLAEKDEVCGRE